MKKLIFIKILLLSIINFSMAQSPELENELYRITISKDFGRNPQLVITHKGSNIHRVIIPQLHIAYSKENPNIVASTVDGNGGIIGWKNAAQKVENNIYALQGIDVVATKVLLKDRSFVCKFKANVFGEATLAVELPLETAAPSFIMGIKAGKEGWYSLGFTGLEATNPKKLDFLYQPLTWSWKRFPSQNCITEEAFATTAATFINTAGFTEGLAVAPEMIPYRYAHSLQWNNAGNKENQFWSTFSKDATKGNSLFGFSVSNAKGMAQPTIFAPLLGGEKSYLKTQESYQFTCKYLLTPGDWMKGTDALLKDIFHYKNERQNALVNLNQTFDNMLNYAMNDVYSGWVAELKASDYCFDVPNTVKNVSALHALGLALVTGNDNIYKLRALPMMEYVMSREKFLFSIEDKPHQAQSPSHLLKGPCVDIGELSGLYQMTKGQTPAFQAEMNRLFGKSRKLNLDTETGGGSWQDYLYRYQISQDKNDLQKAISGAEEYLTQVYDKYPRTFHYSPGLKDKVAFFTTDFGVRIYDLFQLYEQTGNQRYLDASVVGAKQLLLWTRSNPTVPDSIILVNKGGKVEGIFPGRRLNNIEGENPFIKMDETSFVHQQKVPAWHTSLNGLVPEASNTYAFGPVMLAHHAAWLLRLAKTSGDNLLRDVAYNAIIGRYANFPGYYFTSFETNVYQKADYPMHPFFDVKYNAVFYNHVWPHLALLMDFLVSDFYYRSNGKIDFPSTYAPGYAFLTSKVYGNKTGTFMGNQDVCLWVPQGAIASSSVALNHIFGVKGNDLFLALANTSPNSVKQTIRFNPSVIPWNARQAYKVSVYNADSSINSTTTCKDGLMEVIVPANGLLAYKIEGLDAQVTLFQKQNEQLGKPLPTNRFNRETSTDPQWGTCTAMIIQTFPQFADFYFFSDRTEKDWQSAILHYKIGNEEWKIKEDKSYPFEFDVHLENSYQAIEYYIEATNIKGEVLKSKGFRLNE